MFCSVKQSYWSYIDCLVMFSGLIQLTILHVRGLTFNGFVERVMFGAIVWCAYTGGKLLNTGTLVTIAGSTVSENF